MKGVELLQIGERLLKSMSEIGMRTDDYRYLPIYHEYIRQRDEGVKIDAILMELSEKTGISESTLRRAFRRLESTVKC
mgnify:CR=1 FL=1